MKIDWFPCEMPRNTITRLSLDASGEIEFKCHRSRHRSLSFVRGQFEVGVIHMQVPG